MTTPAVSVVIPCYNLGAYLNEAIASVLAQTFDDFEIVVVDDGSTDEPTRSLLSTSAWPKTRVFRTENRGLPAARNYGVRQTSGAYLCMLDADDLLEPTYMAKSVAALEAEPQIAFVSHWLRTFGDEDEVWQPARCDFPDLLDRNTVNGAALVRRSAFEKVGGFDESLREGCEDWDFWISLVTAGLPGRIIPEVLFHYRKRSGSMSRVMLDTLGHPALYARLVAKHSAVFSRHLPALVARRDSDEIQLRRQIEDLALEDYEWTQPTVRKLRDDVAVRERALAKRREEEHAAEAIAQLRTEVARLNALVSATVDEALRHHASLNTARLEIERLDRVVAETAGKALAYHSDHSRAQDEVDAMRRSWSWRLTRPLRALGRVLAGASGGRRT